MNKDIQSILATLSNIEQLKSEQEICIGQFIVDKEIMALSKRCTQFLVSLINLALYIHRNQMLVIG